MTARSVLIVGTIWVMFLPSTLFSQTAEDADFDGSGIVDFADFAAFASAFGTAEPRCDLDGDGRVGFADFTTFAAPYGKRVSSDSIVETFTLGLPGDVALEFVRIEPGTFTMGTTENQKLSLASQGLWQEGVFSDELPAHKVTITRAYMMGKHEVTAKQWMAVMGKTVPNPSDRPVVEVSWEDVQRFVVALNSLAPASTYRLPTEAEWEYACRGGTGTLWACGDLERDVKDHA
ncbi:MAG: formylglycine-generating enzyme family protein [Candidatus Latescibacteria bacterium]|jgi:hypothetical protein|nr:formylglycine-generating enzyme family protein [Candidatus Latescibacterota bacterium]